MNKNFVATLAGSSILVLTMCSSSMAFANKEELLSTPESSIKPQNVFDVAIEQEFQEEFVRQLHFNNMVKALEEKIAKDKLDRDTAIMNDALAELKTYAGKTRYVFAGSTPSGWDCSGLVKWLYSHFDIELYHSATVQMQHGTEVVEPKPGDIVAFQWNGSSRAYHVGIYLEEDMMIDAGSRVSGTRFRSISAFAGNSATIKYVRLVDTN